MPVYVFRCLKCSEKNKEETGDDKIITFEVVQQMNDNHKKAECPICGEISESRVFTSFAISEGLTQAEKLAGTTKHRADLGKYMKDARDKRKKNAKPGTKDAESNELWTGSEADRNVIQAPQNKTK